MKEKPKKLSKYDQAMARQLDINKMGSKIFVIEWEQLKGTPLPERTFNEATKMNDTRNSGTTCMFAASIEIAKKQFESFNMVDREFKITSIREAKQRKLSN